MSCRGYVSAAAVAAVMAFPSVTNAQCCTTEVTARLAAAAQFVDVAGVKLGMPAEQIEAALKKANPGFKMSTELTANWDFAALLTTDSSNDRSKQWIASITGSTANERMTVAVSLPPNRQAAVSISRTINFPEGSQPSVDTIMAGLRAKYGPESAGPDTPSPANRLNVFGNRTVFWYFDADGKPLPPSAPLSQAALGGTGCQPLGSYVPDFNRFGNPNRTHGALTRVVQDKACYSRTVMRVTLGCTAANLTICQNMQLEITNYALLDNSEAVTDAWIDQQRRERIQRQQKQSTGVEAPKL